MAERGGDVLGPPSGSLNPDVGVIVASGSPHFHLGDIAAVLPTSGLWLFEPGKPTYRFLLSPAEHHVPMVFRNGRWIASPGWAIVDPITLPEQSTAHPSGLLLPETSIPSGCLPVQVISHAQFTGASALVQPNCPRYRLRFTESTTLPSSAFLIPEHRIAALLEFPSQNPDKGQKQAPKPPPHPKNPEIQAREPQNTP